MQLRCHPVLNIGKSEASCQVFEIKSCEESSVMPSIDPNQLLGAFETLLNSEGGVNGTDKANQFANVMKKFSKKLVSRCIYCNILRVTKTDVLERLLDEGTWTIINGWLKESKNDDDHHFLIELLEVCKKLPMTLDRLKENNTPKIVKGLTKFDHSGVQALSNELVSKWMSIIKTENTAIADIPPKKNLRSGKVNNKIKDLKDSKKPNKKVSPLKEVKREVKKSAKSVPPPLKLSPLKMKGSKRNFMEKERVKVEDIEDVKLKLDPEPVPKKPKVDRPKTVKSYNTKFRMTGLEEEAPLPKKVLKKNTVDKTAAVAAAKNAITKRLGAPAPERITEKKIKPENLLNINDSAPSGGIKLIAAKPKPSQHVLYESASFMDALMAQPAAPLKRKKKATTKPTTPTTPPSPSLKAPKLQFYKDTLEMNEDVSEKKDSKSEEEKSSNSPKEDNKKETTNGTTDEDSQKTEVNDDDDTAKVSDEEDSKAERDPSVLKSCLAHGKRKRRKKSVTWVSDEDLKEFFFFELDETERVNVGRRQNFGDLKSSETKREREVMEAARRQAGDKMEEAIPWWTVPIYIDTPPPPTDTGCFSREKEIQYIQQQSTLQEIYFSKEMVPDSAQEPEPEIVAPQEPKIIPLDEDNVMGSVMDYSHQENPAPKLMLPDVLASLMNIPSQLQSQAERSPLSPSSPYDPGEPLPQSILGVPPVMLPNFGGPPVNVPISESGPPNDWRPMNMGPPPEGFFPPGGFHLPPHMMMMDPMAVAMSRGGMRPRMVGPMMGDGPRGPFPPIHGRGGPPRRRVPCRHFKAGGCRFGSNCSFLHPGINGPPLT